MTSDGTTTWTYGGSGRATGAGSVSFVVNALGQRVKKTGASSATRFVYDEAGRLWGEYSATGALIQETVWLDDLPVATLRPNGTGVDVYYVHPDHLGTPRAVTRSSDNQFVWKWDNTEPFGNSAPEEDPSGLGTFVFNLRFPGQYFDSETGLHYNYFRDFDPAIGRYVQADPLAIRGLLDLQYGLTDTLIESDAGLEGLVPDLASPDAPAYALPRSYLVGSTLSLYGYANQSPLSMVDPLGLFACAVGDDGGARGSRRRCYQRCQKIYNIVRGGCIALRHPVLMGACLVAAMGWHAGCIHRCNTGQPRK